MITTAASTLIQTSTRVAIVAPTAYPLGGVQTWLDYVVPGLDSAGWDVTVVLVNGLQSNAPHYLQMHPFRQVRLVNNFTGSREGRVRALAKTINSIRPNLVLGVNIADVYEAVTRVRQSGDGKIRVAMALHGLQPCFYEDVAILKDVIDGVVATNRLGAAAATQISGMESERTCYAVCGVDVPDLAATDLTSGPLNLLYAGRFDAAEKRVLDLPFILRALERRQIAFSLRLAGSGPAEPELRKVLATFGDRVEFLGVLNEAALRKSFYTKGSVLLMMSPSETGPLVAWEAMANGVALVTSRFVGIALEGSLREGENCFTFPVGDSARAAEAISKLVDPMRRQAMVRAGYQLVRKRYSREESILSWNGALRDILSRSPRAIPSESTSTNRGTDGRLDRLIGASRAETMRRLVGIRFLHKEAGDEWPHSYSSNVNPTFHEKLKAMDYAFNFIEGR